MKGCKVVQCIKIDSFDNNYALFMAAVCPKVQKKTEPDHEKTFYRGFRLGFTQTQACSVA